MGLTVTRYEREHEPMVRAFNRRMVQGGTHWVFYDSATPTWLAPADSDLPRRDFFVAVDEEVEVRGAYCLKRQRFISGDEQMVASSIQGPVSEGLVDQRFAAVALHLIRDMQHRHAELFAWGASEKLLGVLKRMKWQSFQTPLAMKVVHGTRFLRGARFLRNNPKVRWAADIAAATGLAGATVALTQATLALVAGGAGLRGAQAVEESRFGAWADEVWEAARSTYDFMAARDSKTMNALLPEEGWPKAMILRIERDGQTIGWAAARDTKMSGSPRFGDLSVGSVIDALAKPGEEAVVLKLVTRHLEHRGVDLIVANFSSPVWVRAFRRCGYLISRNRRTLIVSPSLAKCLGETRGGLQGVHLTPLDGDGPLGL